MTLSPFSRSVLFVGFFAAHALAVPLRLPEQRLLDATPIPNSKTAFLEKDWLAEERGWAERSLLIPARARWQGKPWASRAEALVTKALDLRAETNLFEDRLAPLADEFRQLLKEAPEDPVLLWLGAQAYHAEHLDWRASRPSLEKLLALQDLTPLMRSLALRDQIPQLMTQGAEYRYVRGDLVDLLIGLVNDGSYEPKEATVFVRHQIAALDMVGVTMASYLTRWQEAVAGSEWPEWVKETLLGYGDVELAWLERSDDGAVEVKDAQWEGFSRYLKSARTHLEKAWKLRPDRPEAAALMITVTMGDGGSVEDLRVWFDRSVKAQFDYRFAYNKILWALRPRWCGNYQEMLAFGRACAATGRFDTGVPSHLFFAALDVSAEDRKPFDVFRSDQVQPYLERVVQGYLDQTDLPSQVRHLRLSNAAAAAALIGKHDLAQRALDLLKTDLHHCTLEFCNEALLPEARLRAEVAAGAGGFGAAIRELALLPRDGPAEVRRPIFEQLLPDAFLPKGGQTFVREASQRDRFLTDLASGEWIDLPIGPHLTSFIQTCGHWSVAGSDIIAAGDDSRVAILALDLPIKDDLEIRSEVSFENPTNSELSPKGVGFGYVLRWNPSEPGDRGNGVSVVAHQDFKGYQQLQAYHYKPEQNGLSSPLTLKPKNSWLARIASDGLTSVINEQNLLDKLPLDQLGIDEGPGRIGFIVQRLPIGSQVRFSHVQVRRVPSPAPASVPMPDAPIRPIPKPLTSPQEPLDQTTNQTLIDTKPSSPDEVSKPSISTPSNLPAILAGVLVLIAIVTHLMVKPRE